MKRFLLLGSFAAIPLGLAACGGIAVFDDGVGGDAATGTGVGPSTTKATSKSATASTRASTSIQNSANSMSSGSPDIRPTVLRVDLFGNCFLGDGDRILGSVDVQYDNVGFGDGSLDITSAQIGFANPMEGWVFPISLEPTSSGFVQAGLSSVVTHKESNPMDDAAFICNLCSQMATLTLTYDNGTQVGTPFFFNCAF